MSRFEPRLLFDEMVHVGACRQLRDRGVDAVHVLEIEEPLDDDRAVMEFARRSGRIVVTRNYQDFAALVEAYGRAERSFPGVLFLPTSLPQADAGAHVRRIEAWIGRHRDHDTSPVRDTFGWL